MKKLLSLLLILLLSPLMLAKADDPVITSMHKKAFIMGMMHGEMWFENLGTKTPFGADKAKNKRNIADLVSKRKDAIRDEASEYKYAADNDFYQFYLGFRQAALNKMDHLQSAAKKQKPELKFQTHYDLFRNAHKLGADMARAGKKIDDSMITFIKEAYGSQAFMFAYGLYYGYFGNRAKKDIDLATL